MEKKNKTEICREEIVELRQRRTELRKEIENITEKIKEKKLLLIKVD